MPDGGRAAGSSLSPDGAPRPLLDADDGQGDPVVADPARRRRRRRSPRLLGVPVLARRRCSASSSTPAPIGLAMPSDPAPTPAEVDPFTVSEPWRRFVQGAQRSRRRFLDTVRNTSPVRSTTGCRTIAARLDAGLQQGWQVARRGHEIDAAVKALDPTRLRSQLGTLQAPGREPRRRANLDRRHRVGRVAAGHRRPPQGAVGIDRRPAAPQRGPPRRAVRPGRRGQRREQRHRRVRPRRRRPRARARGACARRCRSCRADVTAKRIGAVARRRRPDRRRPRRARGRPRRRRRRAAGPSDRDDDRRRRRPPPSWCAPPSWPPCAGPCRPSYPELAVRVAARRHDARRARPRSRATPAPAVGHDRSRSRRWSTRCAPQRPDRLHHRAARRRRS